MAQKMNSEQEQEEIRKMAAQLWHEETLLEQASKQVLDRQRREQLEKQKRANEMKVNNTKCISYPNSKKTHHYCKNLQFIGVETRGQGKLWSYSKTFRFLNLSKFLQRDK